MDGVSLSSSSSRSSVISLSSSAGGSTSSLSLSVKAEEEDFFSEVYNFGDTQPSSQPVGEDTNYAADASTGNAYLMHSDPLMCSKLSAGEFNNEMATGDMDSVGVDMPPPSAGHVPNSDLFEGHPLDLFSPSSPQRPRRVGAGSNPRVMTDRTSSKLKRMRIKSFLQTLSFPRPARRPAGRPRTPKKAVKQMPPPCKIANLEKLENKEGEAVPKKKIFSFLLQETKKLQSNYELLRRLVRGGIERDPVSLSHFRIIIFRGGAGRDQTNPDSWSRRRTVSSLLSRGSILSERS